MTRVTPLKLAIVASGRRQKDIAAEIGMPEANLSRIVNGLWCEPETQARIAAAVGRTVGELFGDHDAHGADVPGASDGSVGGVAA